MQVAIQARDMGRVMWAFRTHPHHGRNISQEVAAGWVGLTQPRLSRIENGSPVTNLSQLIRWANILGLPPNLRWFEAPTVTTTPQDEAGEFTSDSVDGSVGEYQLQDELSEVDVDRRTFNGMVGGVLTGAVFPASTMPKRVGTADVQYLRDALDRLRNADHQLGGTTLLREALKLFTQAKAILDGADYSEETGRQLMAVTADLGLTSGWCAYDSSNQPLARHVYSEAALLAESIGDPGLIAHVYANMAQQATYLAWGGNRGRAREAVRFVQRAADAARHHPSPRLHALVAMREAMSHSPMGDETAVRVATTRARRELDRGSHPADPTWTEFVTDSEITGQEGIFYRMHGNPDRAVALYRSVLDDTERSPRDRVYYRANLATGLWDSGEHDQAIAEGTALLLEGPMTVRILNELQPVRTGAGAAAEEFCHHYDAAAAALTASAS